MLPRDAAGATPIPTSETDDAILAAMARVEKSLAIVLAQIAEVQAELNKTTTSRQHPPEKPGRTAPEKRAYGRT